MPNLTIVFTGLCLFVPKDQTANPGFVDVLLVDAINPRRTDDGTGLHVQHIPRVRFDPDDVASFDVPIPPEDAWVLDPETSQRRVSWIVKPKATRKHILSILDGANELSGGVSFNGPLGGAAPELPTTDAERKFFRWVPNLHQMYTDVNDAPPTCPNATANTVPNNALARLRLNGGLLAAEDVVSDSTGAPRPFRFKRKNNNKSIRRAMATGVEFTYPLASHLVLQATRLGSGGAIATQIVFRNQDVRIDVLNEPLPFMEDEKTDLDFELLYLPMPVIPSYKRIPVESASGMVKPCSCGSC